jgi:hypothetical protein
MLSTKIGYALIYQCKCLQLNIYVLALRLYRVPIYYKGFAIQLEFSHLKILVMYSPQT